jgi:transcriptional regulator with XRE-family HTH domain
MAKANKNDRFNDTFPTRLRQLVKEKGVTQAELASLLGISRQSFSAYCDGNTQPNIENTVKMAEYFGVSVDYLFGLSDIRATDPATKSLCESLGLSDAAVYLLQNDSRVSKVINSLTAQHATALFSCDDPKVEPMESIFELLSDFLHICESKKDFLLSLTSSYNITGEMVLSNDVKDVIVSDDGIMLDVAHTERDDPELGRISLLRYIAKEKIEAISEILEWYSAAHYHENVFMRKIQMHDGNQNADEEP